MSTHNIPKRKNHPKLSQICTYGIFSQGLKHEFEIAIDDSERAISVRATEVLLYVFPYKLAEADKKKNYGSFWPGLGLPRPKAIVVIPQNQPLPKHLRKKTSKSAKHACQYARKERPVKITMYLGLDIIIKIKFTTIFNRCAILNVLNYLTKNFES